MIEPQSPKYILNQAKLPNQLKRRHLESVEILSDGKWVITISYLGDGEQLIGRRNFTIPSHSHKRELLDVLLGKKSPYEAIDDLITCIGPTNAFRTGLFHILNRSPDHCELSSREKCKTIDDKMAELLSASIIPDTSLAQTKEENYLFMRCKL